MAYKRFYPMCRERSHGELDYEGKGDYICPICGMEYHDNEYDDYYDEGEGLSVYDAALIWASHGKDEDYTFGYSEEELEDAL